MSFSKTVPATIDILITSGNIYELDAVGIKKKFLVTSGDSSIMVGALDYNDTDDLSGNQIGTTSTVDNKLVVTFVKGSIATGKFTSSNSLPNPVVVTANSGTWSTNANYETSSFLSPFLPVVNSIFDLDDEELPGSSLSGAILTNSGSVPLVIVDGTETWDVAVGATYPLSATDGNISVQASSKTVALITYQNSSACTLSKGTQVAGAKFDLGLTMRA